MSVRTRLFLNDPAQAVSEMLEGYAAAHSDIIRISEGMVVRATPKPKGRVGVVIGNGSGHEPAMIGWIGEGLLDVNVAGPIFSSPGPGGILGGIKAADRGAGVLLLVSSHAGDIMNATLAIDEAEDEGIEDVEMVILYDDVASAPKDRITERRGGAGLFFVWKMVGAIAERGGSLEDCARVARKARDRTRSLSAAMGTVAHPISGQPLGDPEDTSVAVGMGVHGEAGARLGEDVGADQISELMLERLVDDADLVPGDQVGLLLNNAGSLTVMELSILYRGARAVLERHGIEVARSWMGPYATTIDMAGFSFAICHLDNELTDLYDAAARGAAFTMPGRH
ncbi:MAG: dihydroxyacetone kinase subunit DhaK [Actinomycetia bacterium]|nr:dihydroxyacetone kinase subunit DhaK [Actinomycetes bacterium]